MVKLMKFVVFILRTAISVLFLVSVLAGLNSLPFPGVGILIAAVGLSVALWSLITRLANPEKAEEMDRRFAKAGVIFAMGLLIASWLKIT